MPFEVHAGRRCFRAGRSTGCDRLRGYVVERDLRAPRSGANAPVYGGFWVSYARSCGRPGPAVLSRPWGRAVSRRAHPFEPGRLHRNPLCRAHSPRPRSVVGGHGRPPSSPLTVPGEAGSCAYRTLRTPWETNGNITPTGTSWMRAVRGRHIARARKSRGANMTETTKQLE